MILSLSHRFALLGKFYGYPECCIEAFIVRYLKGEEITPEQESVHKNLGFVPCQECSQKIIHKETSVENLISHRICSKPYPEAPINEMKRFLQSKNPLNYG